MTIELEKLAHQEPNLLSAECPTRKILDLISDKWSTLIITLLHGGSKRFSELHRRIEGISQKMLTQNLRNLERSGLLTRRVYAEVPPRVEYTITALGETLYQPISAIQRWTEQHYLNVLAAQSDYDQKALSKVEEAG